LTPVFDSAAQLEQLSLQLLPDVFNSEGTNETFDGRSDNKGALMLLLLMLPLLLHVDLLADSVTVIVLPCKKLL
jgi:hypothetical protein